MKKTLLMTTLVFLTCCALQASPCAIGTLATYDTGGFSCTLGGLTFSDFVYSPSNFGGAAAPPDSGVAVRPITIGSEMGLQFSAAWLVSSGQGEDSTITYTLNCSPGCTDAELITVGGATGNGSASVAEGSTPTLISLFSANSNSDMQTFAPVGTLTLTKDIGVVGGQSGSAHMSVVDNLFSQSGMPPVPEPSMLLLCLGVCALVPLARRKLRRRVAS